MECPRRNECLKHPAGIRRKNMHAHTHMHAVVAVLTRRLSLSLQLPLLPVAHAPLCPPDPSSPFIHSSRIYPASLTRHVSGQMSKKPPFSNRGEEIPSIQPRLFPPTPLPAFSLPLFLAPSLLTCGMIDNIVLASLLPVSALSAQHLQPCRETSSPR